MNDLARITDQIAAKQRGGTHGGDAGPNRLHG
jgi:hypothetical protein